MKLVISLATRGRPEQVVDTIRRSIVNWTNKNTAMVVQIDDDDPATLKALQAAKFDERVTINSRPREDTIAEKWNRILSVPADVYKSAADDDPYVIPGYDDRILEAAKRFPDGIGTVYGAMANLSFTGVSAPTKKMCDLLGYIFPPYFPYWFVDHWVDDVFKMIGRISYAHVHTDQSKAGKTQELREPFWWATFFDACYLMRRKQARAILDHPSFAGEKWQKDLVFSTHPIIEQRSRAVNESVRQQAKQLEGSSGLTLNDARYQRIRKRAEKMAQSALADPDMPEQERAVFGSILFPATTIPSLKQAFA